MNADRSPDIARRHQAIRAAWNEAARRYEMEIEEDIAFLRAGGQDLKSWMVALSRAR